VWSSEIVLIIRFIGDRAGNYFKRDDPYFEATEDTPGVLPFLTNVTIREKSRNQRKRHYPRVYRRGTPKSSRKFVEGRILWVSPLSDNLTADRSLSCCCCGFRFGWSAVIGLIPVIGDILDMLIALSIIRTCMEAELPNSIVPPGHVICCSS
jgi:hypothetical protein